MALAIFRTPSV